MAERLEITDLEFESIKNNLKLSLQNQTAFKDYNFEGSAISQLINLLAYNTYYNSYYYNMMANELFIDSAQVRNSILSHAKALNYTPISRRAATAIVDVTVTPPGGNTQSQLTLDRFQEFQSEAVDGINYTFVTTDAVTVYKENGVFPFTNLEIKAGTPQVTTFLFDPISNPDSQFELPNPDIDTSTLAVTVQVSSVNTSARVFSLSTDIATSTPNTEVYYLSTSINNKYKISFGDGAVSKALSNGNIVIATYLTTDGEPANKANSFATGSIGGFSNVSVRSVSAAAGGADRESDASVKLRAPLAYTAQGRAVTHKDYQTLISSVYPDIQSLSVWGGEDNRPPVYGKVFISIAPKEGVILNNTEKFRILTELVNPMSMVTITPELVDPDYVYLKFETKVNVDGRLTLLTGPQISEVIRTAIIDYTSATLNQFDALFSSSKFGRAIDDSLPAILGSDSSVRLEKRVTPKLNVASTYVVSFRTELRRSALTRALRSTAFTTYDSANNLRTAYLEEVSDSFTGIDSIEVTNPGYNYLDTPAVIITGDGVGAQAEAVVVNGRIERITMIDRGTGYTSAIVSIVGGGGISATASAVIEERFGTARLFYFNSRAEKVDIDSAVGLIDYMAGEITLYNLNVIESLSPDGLIRISVEPQDDIIETQRNQLLSFDVTDSSAALITVNIR
jgi:hypothetical protein